ncbi:MAG TPA: hypothetical protein VHU18_07865 [Rhizomicrobium sp.]|nr:hypothetical protein [Rhizomicrobium sp.]
MTDIPGQHNSTTLEHLVPKAVDVWNGDINLVVACMLCNQGRGTMLVTSYFDLVKKHGRIEAHRLGRRWQKGDPQGLREKAVSQHLRGTMYRGLAEEYRKRNMTLTTSPIETVSDQVSAARRR